MHSPYLTTLVSLLIGPKKARFRVPRAFLSESPQWSRPHSPEFSGWSDEDNIDLPGVNEEVGHTLVHYLYTGTFQKLQSPEDDDLTAELKNNVHLYGIATNYGLVGLKELALEKIQTQEGLGDIFDTLVAIKEASKTLPQDDLGLKPYIKKELKAALESDDTLFEKERFLELFGEAKQFDRILIRIVTEIYSEKVAHISQNKPVIINRSGIDAIFTTELSSPPSRNETLREEPETVGYEEPTGCEKLDEYEKPAVREHPVTYGDLVGELDPGEEFTIRKRVPIPEKDSTEKSEEPTPECSPWDPALRHDQAVCEYPSSCQQDASDDAILPNVSNKLEEPTHYSWSYWKPSASCEDPVPCDKSSSLEPSVSCKVSVPCDEPAPVEWSFTPISCKSPVAFNIPVTCEGAAPRAEAILVPFDRAASGEETLDWTKGKKAKKGKKMKKRYVIINKLSSKAIHSPSMSSHHPEKEAAPLAETVPCAETATYTEVVPCAEVVPRAEEVPCAEVAPCAESVTFTEAIPCIEAASQEIISCTKKTKGKKSKKGKTGYDILIIIIIIIRLSSFSGEANHYYPCSSWTAKYGDAEKKDSQNAEERSEFLDPVPCPSTSHETVNESPLPIVMDTKYDLELLQHADESSFCASRATHLLVGDEWKKCPNCRMLIHHLSLELGRNMIVDHKDGYALV